MTIITPTGITGITSITSTGNTLQFQTPAGANINVSGLSVSSGTDINVTGIVTATRVNTTSITGVSTAGITSVITGAGTTAAPSISPTGDSNTGIFFPSADTIAFGEGGVESARFDSSGRLGIGTNNPSNLIHLYSTSDGAELLQLEIGAQPVSSGKGKIIWRATQTNGQSAKLTSIGATAVSNWGGEFQIFTKLANGTPNDTIVERVRVDNAGRVTMPYQPSFAAWLTANQTNVTGNGIYYTLICNSTSGNSPHNVGGHYDTSTGVFTAPISGYYQFNAHILYSTDVYGRGGELWLSYNNDTYRWFLDRRFIASTSGTISETSGSVMIYVAANDNIRVRGFITGGSQNVSILGNNTESSVVTHFTGRLLG